MGVTGRTTPASPRQPRGERDRRREPAEGERIVPLDAIDTDRRFQIRLEPRPGELLASLEREGQLVPVLLQKVGDRYRIIDGHRRCASLERLRASTVRAVVREVPDYEALRLAFIANHARKTLAPADRWNGVRMLTAHGWSETRIAEALGLHPVTVRRLRGLFPDLPEVGEGLKAGWLRPSHLRALRRLVPKASWPKWLRIVRDERLSAVKLYDRVGVEQRRRQPPYVAREPEGALVFRGFRFDPKTAYGDEIWRAVTQYDEGMDQLRAWLRRRR